MTLKWKKENTVKYTTWNVRSTIHKEELDTVFKEQNTDNRNKNKLQGTKETQNYTLIYSGVNLKKTEAQAGVMIWIHKALRNKILHYTYWNERILEVRPKLCREILQFLAYMPQKKDTMKTMNSTHNYTTIHNELNKNDYVILAGDLNARVGNKSIHKNTVTFGE
jgi:tRNA(His) 5'-end guanylyltransferase